MRAALLLLLLPLAQQLLAAAVWQPIRPLIAYPTLPPPSLVAPYQLLIDRARSPALGVETDAPLLSWAVPASITVQTAARVVVSTGLPSPTVHWDSGWVNGSSPSLVYSGPPLARTTQFTWTVQVDGAGGQASAVSEPATFVTGLRGTLDLGTSPLWVSNSSASFVFLRAEVPLTGSPSAVAWAVAFVTASSQVAIVGSDAENSKLLGAYKLWVNGGVTGVGPGKPSRCGPLCPIQKANGTCTCSPEQLVDARDVTELVRGSAVGAATRAASGSTVTLALAGFNYPPSTIPVLPVPSRMLLELHIEYADGSGQVIGTDAQSGAWAALDATPYMRPNGNFGDPQWYASPRESFDARMEPVGWREPGYIPAPTDPLSWEAPAAVEPFGAPLVAKPTEAVVVVGDPARVAPPPFVAFYANSSVLFADFGVEFSGGVCLDVQAGVGGTTLYMALAEEVEYTGEGPDTVISARPMRTANNYTQEWTLRDGPQTVCMHEYAQFRYVQFNVLPSERADEELRPLAPMGPSVRAWVLMYPAPYVPSTSFSVASNGNPDGPGGDSDVQALEGVWGLSWYTRAAQTSDQYYDHVRQRDVACVEELTLDMLQQYALSTEWRMQPFVMEYLLNSRPLDFGWAEWPALSIFSIHEIFLHSGDLTVFRQHYGQMRNFTGLALINASTGLWTCVGTLMNCDHPEVDWPESSRDGFVMTPTNAVVNMIIYRAMCMFSEMAAAVGNVTDAALFANVSSNLRDAINSHLWDPASGVYRDGVTTSHAAWHSSAFALGMGVPTEAMLPRVVQAVLDKMAPGNASVGVCFPSNVWPTQWTMEGLYRYLSSDHGYIALSILTCSQPQGWVAMLENNYTQAAEAWSDLVKPNQELGMTWGAAPGDILPRLMLGVLPTAPGFATVQVMPQPGPLAGVSGTVPTIRGPISVQYAQTFAPGGAASVAVGLTSSSAPPASVFRKNATVATADMSLSLPGNVPASACLPLSACTSSLVSVDGAAVAGTVQGDYVCVDVASAGKATGEPRRLQCPAR